MEMPMVWGIGRLLVSSSSKKKCLNERPAATFVDGNLGPNGSNEVNNHGAYTSGLLDNPPSFVLDTHVMTSTSWAELDPPTYAEGSFRSEPLAVAASTPKGQRQFDEFSNYSSSPIDTNATTEPPSPMSSVSVSDDGEPYIYSSSESLDDINIPISYRNTAVVNKVYQDRIVDVICAIESQLERNLREQRDTIAEIAMRTGKNEAKQSKVGLGFFSYPYFKDSRGFSHPPNADTVKKRSGDELDVYITKPKELDPSQKKKLTQKVAAEARRKLLQPVQTELKALTRATRRNDVSKEQKEEQTEQMALIERDIKTIEMIPEEELLGERDDHHDWMSIAQSFPSHISPRSCELTWRHVVHPSCGGDRLWTAEEDAKLKELVAAGDLDLWEDVAASLGIGRSGYQCFARFRREEVKESSVRCTWTEDDDERLFQLVEEFRIEEFVPWPKVAYFMNGKTKEQCTQRYTMSLRSNLKKGTFLEEEDFLILAGVEVFGKAAWAQIADFLPQRTANQLSSRYHGYLNADFSCWTPDENRRLLALTQKQKETTGKVGDWAAVAKELNEGSGSDVKIKRSRMQVKIQFGSIYKAFEKYRDDFRIEKMKSSDRQQLRLEEIKAAFDYALEEFIDERKEMTAKDEGEEDCAGDGHLTTRNGLVANKEDLKAFLALLRVNIQEAYEEASKKSCSRKPFAKKSPKKSGTPKKKDIIKASKKEKGQKEESGEASKFTGLKIKKEAPKGGRKRKNGDSMEDSEASCIMIDKGEEPKKKMKRVAFEKCPKIISA